MKKLVMRRYESSLCSAFRAPQIFRFSAFSRDSGQEQKLQDDLIAVIN
jgi:hypothetical protein